MNKLLLNSEDDINTLVIEEDTQLEINFEDVQKDIHILVEDSVLLNIIEISKNTKNKFSLELGNESRVIYNKFSVDCNDYIYVLLDGKYSSIKLNNSAVNNSDSSIKFLIEHNNTNTDSYLSNHGINNSTGNMSFIVDSKVNPSAMKSTIKQESKITNIKSGKSSILPNLIVDLDDVEASHSAYISDFNQEYMFYMKSRGIDEKTAKKLLVNGFLIGNLDVDYTYREKILNEVKI
ncbi:MAG: SufD family Fe-S cluster assembly protein [Bacilli bacterium]